MKSEDDDFDSIFIDDLDELAQFIARMVASAAPADSYEDEMRVVAELERVGAPVERVDGVHGCYRLDDDQYALAVPVLLEHLQIDYPTDLRVRIARAMGDRRVRPWWREVKALYLREESEEVRSELAIVLSDLALRKNWDELVELVNNEALGGSRIFLLRPARRIGNRMDGTSGTQLMEQFRNHPRLGNEATAILKGLSPNEG